MALRADLILLPGDLFQGTDDEFERELPALRHLLSRLSAPGGVYFAMGDVDQHPDRVPRMIEGTRVEPLVNRVVRVSVGDRSSPSAAWSMTTPARASSTSVTRQGSRRPGTTQSMTPPSDEPSSGVYSELTDGRGPQPTASRTSSPCTSPHTLTRDPLPIASVAILHLFPLNNYLSPTPLTSSLSFIPPYPLPLPSLDPLPDACESRCLYARCTHPRRARREIHPPITAGRPPCLDPCLRGNAYNYCTLSSLDRRGIRKDGVVPDGKPL
jgi:hypothetical protein